MIYCARCETYKPESEYYASINRSWCKPCRVEYSKAKYANLSPEERADLLRVTAEKRRIRNQRKTLRRLEKSYQTLRLVKERYMMESFWRQSRHVEAAAKVAERFWFGRRIARAIRRAA